MEFTNACRAIIPEGIVLLKNDGALPLKDGENIALFGRASIEYEKSGSGSGGRVSCPYVRNLDECLNSRVALDKDLREYYKNYIKQNPYDYGDGWHNPSVQKSELPPMSLIQTAGKRAKKAVFVLSRVFGESFDIYAKKGEWYLSDIEEQTLKVLCENFEKVIVLINGTIMNCSWIEKYPVSAVAYIWQGGQEGALGTVDALLGDIAPSGRLTGTIANETDWYSTNYFGDKTQNIHAEDIFVGYRYFQTFAPEKVQYPFGYGLGYTQFSMQTERVERRDNTLSLSVRVKNIGDYHGKEVVQVYIGAPSGKLGKPARVLGAFQKTQTLQAGQEEVVSLSVDFSTFASFDESISAFVLEQGEYAVFVGKNVRDAEKVYSFTIEKTIIIAQCQKALSPVSDFTRLVEKNGQAVIEEVKASKRLPVAPCEEIAYTGDKGITLQQVKSGEYSLDEFIAQFDGETLCSFVKGEGMSSPKGSMSGTAACFGGLSSVWADKGVPVISVCDGPSGVRMENEEKVTCIPSGVSLASTFAPELIGDIYHGFAREMKKYGIDVILGPGINIHRHPFGGRNFEYFSEDPFVTGCFASAIAKYFYEEGVFCTLKHFAVNSQEYERERENEVLSERALREIYLKGFEMAVKSGFVYSIMTAYNRVNGISTGGCYDLTTRILREDWGYNGFVMTDWWPIIDNFDNNTFDRKNRADMVRAQNDIYMVVSDASANDDDLCSSYQSGKLSLGQLQRSVKNLLRFIMQTISFAENKNMLTDRTKHGKLLFSVAPKQNSVALDLEKDGVCFVETEYIQDGAPLAQFPLHLIVDERKPNILIVKSTEGESAKVGLQLRLQRNSVLRYEATAKICKVSVYGIE